MKRLFILLPLSLLVSCSTFYYPNGKKAAVIGSNVKGLVVQSGPVSIKGDFDNAIIHREVGNTLIKGGMGAAMFMVKP